MRRVVPSQVVDFIDHVFPSAKHESENAEDNPRKIRSLFKNPEN